MTLNPFILLQPPCVFYYFVCILSLLLQMHINAEEFVTSAFHQTGLLQSIWWY